MSNLDSDSSVGRTTSLAMPVLPTLEVLAKARRPYNIVITNQVSARLWPLVSNSDFDFNYNPSTMGGAVPLALGLALAQPQREVVVVTGDGSLLMSLGSLVSVVDSGAKNLTVVVLDNGTYEVTGCQPTPARRTGMSYAEVAAAIGFRSSLEFCNLDAWKKHADDLFAASGPRFISLRVEPTPRQLLETTGPAVQQQLNQLRVKLW